MTDVIEKVARAIEVASKTRTSWREVAQAALAALEPGDELGGVKFVANHETYYAAECQARAEEREACLTALHRLVCGTRGGERLAALEDAMNAIRGRGE